LCGAFFVAAGDQRLGRTIRHGDILMKRVKAFATLSLVALLVIATGGWGVLALAFAGPHDDTVRTILAAAFAGVSLATLMSLISRRWRLRVVTAYCVVFAALLTWWQGILPSNSRDWQTDVAVIPYATIEGDMVTVHNIRNFAYRSEADYTPAYYDRRFDLRKLNRVDLVAAYWMGPAIAHVFLSFGFADGHHLAVSIETRKEKGESYSTIKGFFRQYELFYVVGDERDVIRLRTNYRRNPAEDIYVYPLVAPMENGRRVFLEYMNRINALNARPEFYNTLTTNCTTNIWLNSRVNPAHVPFSWKILLSGYVPEFLYEQGRLGSNDEPFSEIQQRAYINPRAQEAGNAADFSRRIRLNTPAGP
jgi:hypothetical protein